MESSMEYLLDDGAFDTVSINSNALFTIHETTEDRVLDGSIWDDSKAAEIAQIHVRAKRRRITATCSECDQDFTEKRSLLRHQRSSTRCKPEGAFQESHACSACERVFTRPDVLKQHETEHHNMGGRTLALSNLKALSHPYEGESTSGFDDPDVDGLPHKVANGQEGPAAIKRTEESNQDYSSQLIEEYPNVMLESQALIKAKGDPPESCAPDVRGVDAGTEIGTPLPCLPVRHRSSLERIGAGLGRSQTNNSFLCPACRKPFEKVKTALLIHIESHIKDWQQQFECPECEIKFQRVENLNYHLRLAKRGDCGFIGFEHACSGHHPPTKSDNVSNLTKHEHLMLTVFTEQW